MSGIRVAVASTLDKVHRAMLLALKENDKPLTDAAMSVQSALMVVAVHQYAELPEDLRVHLDMINKALDTAPQ